MASQFSPVGSNLETYSLCEAGPVRTNNEDSIAVHYFGADKGTMLIVSDGMGGREKGELASAMVTREFPDLYLNSTIPNCVEALVEAINQINQAVYARSAVMQMSRGMGATIVACVVVNGCLVTVNVGDSRAYLLHDGSLRQLSHDHTLRKPAFPLSDKKVPGDFSHVLTQAIGPNPSVSPHVNITRMTEGDTLLLCSDGLSSVVSEKEIAEVLLTISLADCPSALYDLVTRRGGDDNVSVILGRALPVQSPNGSEPADWGRRSFDNDLM